jgi:uncharacterized protein YgbK (DUF1537 family)
LVWGIAAEVGPIFVAGSSGLEYALVADWRKAGYLPEPPTFRTEPVDRIVVVSGSCSPVTARQIDWATANGFRDIPVSPEAWAEGVDGRAIEAIVAEVGRLAPASVIVHAARGPDDPRFRPATDTGPRLGRFLGAVLDRVLGDIRRVCVAGGDTSGYVARELGVRSLGFVAPVAPGSPLCRVDAPGRVADGAEICFKGGQVGKPDFFGLARAGRRQT